MRLRVIFCLLLLSLFGCAEQTAECTAIPMLGRYCLQSSAAAASFSVLQKVDVRFRKKRETLIAQVDNDASGMTFVGMTPFGQTLLQVDFDNREARAVRTPDARIPPALVIALLQISLWPQASVQRGLGDEIQVVDEGNVRRLVRDGQTLLQVEHDASPAPYQNLQINLDSLSFQLNIQTLPELQMEPSSQ